MEEGHLGLATQMASERPRSIEAPGPGEAGPSIARADEAGAGSASSDEATAAAALAAAEAEQFAARRESFMTLGAVADSMIRRRESSVALGRDRREAAVRAKRIRRSVVSERLEETEETMALEGESEGDAAPSSRETSGARVPTEPRLVKAAVYKLRQALQL